MINITSLANFLSINAKDIKEIDTFDRDDGNFITITLNKVECCCTHCHNTSYVFKEYRIREIKHALFIGKKTTFLLKSRRYKCLSCGKTFMEPNILAPRKSRISYESIMVILDAARKYNATWKEIGEKAHVSDETAINVFDRYVNLPRGKLSRVISIDECYNKHQFDKPYSCIIFDFLQTKIIDVIEDRSKLNLSHYFSKIPREEREMVQYVVIDMWEPYLDIATIYFPNAVVAIDSFHVIKEIGFALDKVRKRIMNGYPKGTTEYYLLKKWNDTLFSEYKPWEDKFKLTRLGGKWVNKYQLQQMILDINEELKIAHTFYKMYKHRNQITNVEAAEDMLEDFINDKQIIKIQEFIPVIQMLSNWKEWIINSFNIVNERRISNGPIEGFNSNFKKMMTVSNGLFSHLRFRNRLMYCYNRPNCIVPVKTRIIKKSRGERGSYKKPEH